MAQMAEGSNPMPIKSIILKITVKYYLVMFLCLHNYSCERCKNLANIRIFRDKEPVFK